LVDQYGFDKFQRLILSKIEKIRENHFKKFYSTIKQ